jgi:hypothetical protein
MSRLINAAILLTPILMTSPAIASMVDTPACERDLARADELVHGIRLRENSVQQGDIPGLCRLLRQNLKDMSKARELMNRCMTGHERGENVGQMDASIGDIRYVLDNKCR